MNEALLLPDHGIVAVVVQPEDLIRIEIQPHLAPKMVMVLRDHEAVQFEEIIHNALAELRMRRAKPARARKVRA